MTLNKSLDDQLKDLERSQGTHFQVCGRVLKADGGAMFPVDFIALAVLHRSLALLRGFCHAIRDQNFICAVPLVRMQLDNLLRFYALSLVDNPHTLALKILGGDPLRKFPDRTGRKMTDSYLVEKLSEYLPWVKRLYKETSGYIHLSEKHIFNTIVSVDHVGRTVEHGVTGYDIGVPDSLRLEAVAAMREITKQLLGFVETWAHTKEVVGATKGAPKLEHPPHV